MYIIECRDGPYYVGKANNLHYRIGEHSGRVESTRHSKYVKAHGFYRVVYFEEFHTEEDALARESLLKHWHPDRYARHHLTPIRQYKDYLVSGFPEWKLEAFHATEDDSALRRRISRGRQQGLPDFIPKEPLDWWAQETKRAAEVKAIRDAEFSAGSEGWALESYDRQRRFARNVVLGWALLFALVFGLSWLNH